MSCVLWHLLFGLSHGPADGPQDGTLEALLADIVSRIWISHLETEWRPLRENKVTVKLLKPSSSSEMNGTKAQTLKITNVLHYFAFGSLQCHCCLLLLPFHLNLLVLLFFLILSLFLLFLLPFLLLKEDLILNLFAPQQSDGSFLVIHLEEG